MTQQIAFTNLPTSAFFASKNVVMVKNVSRYCCDLLTSLPHVQYFYLHVASHSDLPVQGGDLFRALRY